MQKIREALGLFPSMIKSGESWTLTSIDVLADAKGELTALEVELFQLRELRKKVDDALAKFDQLALEHPAQALIIKAFTNDFR